MCQANRHFFKTEVATYAKYQSNQNTSSTKHCITFDRVFLRGRVMPKTVYPLF